jgi:hypothetical protein
VAGTCLTPCPTGTCPGDEECIDGYCCSDDAHEASGGDSCTDPVDLGALYDHLSSHLEVHGFVTGDEDSDWFRVTADDDDDAVGDEFNFEVRFTNNPGHLEMDVFYEGCADSDPCLDEQTCFNWYTDFSDGSLGEDPCRDASSAPGFNECSDNTAAFFIHVHAPSTGPICAPYTLRISNNPAAPGPGCDHR